MEGVERKETQSKIDREGERRGSWERRQGNRRQQKTEMKRGRREGVGGTRIDSLETEEKRKGMRLK